MMGWEDGEITLRREFKRDARVCTDKWMAIIYYLFIGSLLYLAKIGYSGGEILKLLAPLDGDNNFCGIK